MKKSRVIFFLILGISIVSPVIAANLQLAFSSLDNWQPRTTISGQPVQRNTSRNSFQSGENYYQIGISYAREKTDAGYAEAATWFKQAADQGFVLAQLALGIQYLNGFGVKKDEREAVNWLQKAADQRNGLAELELGMMYTRGYDATPRDYAKAVRYYEMAIQDEKHKGPLAEAEKRLGFMYLKGYGVPQDKAKGKELLKKAIENGDEFSALIYKFE